MTGFDTDVLSLLLIGHPGYVGRLAAIPQANRYAPVVAAGEALRGRLAAVRAAESGKGRQSLAQAYALFEKSLIGLRGYQLLPYTQLADAQFAAWRRQGVRIGSQDLRIAAICHTSGARLATRNARDFGQIPGFGFDIWP